VPADGQLWWHFARASGIVAWALATLAILWGLVLSSKVLGKKPRPSWVLDLHRFVGGLTVAFLGVHVAAIVADSYVHFGVADVLVPFASDWRPTAVAWGVMAAYLLVAVEATSLVRHRIPKRTWHLVHLTSLATYALGTIHALTAGADATSPVFRLAVVASVAAVVALTVMRVVALRLAPKRQPVVASSAFQRL
jgi:methionine sulfoxide reductase heme-binding subunit